MAQIVQDALDELRKCCCFNPQCFLPPIFLVLHEIFVAWAWGSSEEWFGHFLVISWLFVCFLCMRQFAFLIFWLLFHSFLVCCYLCFLLFVAFWSLSHCADLFCLSCFGCLSQLVTFDFEFLFAAAVLFCRASAMLLIGFLLQSCVGCFWLQGCFVRCDVVVMLWRV